MALVPLRNVLQRAHFRPGLQGLFAALSFPLPTCLCVSVCARSAFLTYKDKPFFRLSFSPAFPCVCVLYFWAGDVNLAGDCRTVIKGKARQWGEQGGKHCIDRVATYQLFKLTACLPALPSRVPLFSLHCLCRSLLFIHLALAGLRSLCLVGTDRSVRQCCVQRN